LIENVGLSTASFRAIRNNLQYRILLLQYFRHAVMWLESCENSCRCRVLVKISVRLSLFWRDRILIYLAVSTHFTRQF